MQDHKQQFLAFNFQIIIRDNENGTCMLIDVAISGDRNVIKNREDSEI
jgi:hypothetical protein